jgi:hypothetical protein
MLQKTRRRLANDLDILKDELGSLREKDHKLEEEPLLEFDEDFRLEVGEICQNILFLLPERVGSFFHELGKEPVIITRNPEGERWSISTAECFYICQMEGNLLED